jgi:hypothetical protein
VREEQTKEIGASTYLVRQLPATQAQRLFVRLSKLVGPAIAELTTGGKDGLKGAAMHVLGGLEPSDVEDITKQMAKMSEVDNKPLDKIFDVHFTGKQAELWQWLLFALEVQYKDFFDVLRGLFAEAAVGSGSTSPSISGGQPGA